MNPKNVYPKVLVILCLFILLSCYAKPHSAQTLLDFESDQDLDQIRWMCGVLLAHSNKHVTHGQKSLKMEIYPSDYPGLHPILVKADWRGYGQLCFDAYNPEEKQAHIVVRIDDRKDSPDYNDRYNKNFILKPGINCIRIPLDTINTSVTNRQLDLSNICKLVIFISHPKEKTVLYVDYIRLEI